MEDALCASYRERTYKRYASLFQQSAPIFDRRHASYWGKPYNYYLRDWLPENKSDAILDAACGGGNLLWFLQERGYSSLIGVDVSHEQAALARQIVPEIYEEDVLKFLATTPTRFDLVIGMDIIEHLRKDEILQFLDGCQRILRPGGRIILKTPNAESPWGTDLRYADFTHEIALHAKSVTYLLTLCGLENVELREAGPTPRCGGLKCTLRWLGWQIIRLGLKLYNVTETGMAGSGVLTRVLFASATKSVQEDTFSS